MKLFIALSFLFTASCADFRNSQADYPLRQYVAETSGEIYIKFNSRGDFLELVTFSSTTVEIDHPSAKKKAESIALIEARKSLIAYFEEEVESEVFLSKIENVLGDSQFPEKQSKKKIARKLQENLILNRMKIVNSLNLHHSRYNKEANKLEVTLLSQNSLTKILNKVKKLLDE